MTVSPIITILLQRIHTVVEVECLDQSLTPAKPFFVQLCFKIENWFFQSIVAEFRHSSKKIGGGEVIFAKREREKLFSLNCVKLWDFYSSWLP
jgi:hypothetical protein